MSQQEKSERQPSIEIRFRCQAKKKSEKGFLFEFLQHDEILTSKEMILQAVKAYWMPIAMAKTNYFSEDELSQVGLRAIQELRRQMTEIAWLTGLELENVHFFGENPLQESLEPERIEHLEVDLTQETPLTDLGL